MRAPVALVFLALLVGFVAGCPTAQKPVAPPHDTASTADPLTGTEWILQDLAGTPVLPNAQVTLAFPETGKAGGFASCNRYTGSVTVSGSSIKFGPLASTRMACTDQAVSNQESKFLQLLGEAERFEHSAKTLSIFAKGQEKPLQFSRNIPAHQ